VGARHARLPDGAARAAAAAVHVGLGAVLHAVHAARRDAHPARAHAARAVHPGLAALAPFTLARAAAAAVDVGLVAVLRPVGAGRRLAHPARAHGALAVGGLAAHLADVARR